MLPMVTVNRSPEEMLPGTVRVTTLVPPPVIVATVPEPEEVVESAML